MLPILGGGLIAGGAAILGALIAGARRPARRYYHDPLEQQIELPRALSALRLEPPRPVFQPGDHIRVPCWFGPIPYHHHGIVSWDVNSAIHYDSAGVRQTSLDLFAGSAGLDAIELVERPYDAQNVLARARSALGSKLWAEGTYDLRSNNCEHFARWCVCGWGYSQQVVTYSILRSGTIAAAGALVRRLWGSAIARVGAALGLGSLLPGLGWILLGAGIVYAVDELAKGLGFCCNGQCAEIDGSDIRRAALAQGVQFV
jgi:hypothetical protein